MKNLPAKYAKGREKESVFSSFRDFSRFSRANVLIMTLNKI